MTSINSKLYGLLLLLLLLNFTNSKPFDDFGNQIDDNDNDDYDDTSEVDESDYDESIDLAHFGKSIFGEPNATIGERLDKYDPEKENVNPEELGTYIEGDILMPSTSGRNGLASPSSRWPNGIVPYEINGGFDAIQMDLIEKAFNVYHARTCIKFVPRTNQADYISITNGRTGCWSSVGRIGGRQEVNFQTPGCMSKVGTVLHELMHACGFFHEQNRFERDDYIIVRFENIRPGTENNFDKLSAATSNSFGVGYDYGSVMHYSPNAFSTNGLPTIVPIRNAPTMGQRDGFSASDIAKLNGMYNCGANINNNNINLNNNNINNNNNNINNPNRPNRPNRPTRRPRPTRPQRPGNNGTNNNAPNPLLTLIGNFFGSLLNQNEEVNSEAM